MKKVNIILPTHNGMRYLESALKSCLDQTYPNIEIIIVNDGSRDGTADYLDRLDNPSVRVIHHPTNYGLPQALNTGFAAADGDYLTWTSDDNLLEPTAIAQLVTCLEDNPDVDFVYADFWRIDENGAVIERVHVGPPEDLAWHNPVGACFLYRYRVYTTLGDFNPDARLAEDTEYWIRTYVAFQMMRYSVPLYRYRLHGRSLTGTDFNAFAAMRVSARSRRRIMGLSWPAYARQMAKAYIEETFARYRTGDNVGARRCVWKALAYNPAWLQNRGVLSIAMKTTFGRIRLA